MLKKCSKVINNNDIKIKRKIDGKISVYYHCIDCGFKKFETIDKEGI